MLKMFKMKKIEIFVKILIFLNLIAWLQFLVTGIDFLNSSRYSFTPILDLLSGIFFLILSFIALINCYLLFKSNYYGIKLSVLIDVIYGALSFIGSIIFICFRFIPYRSSTLLRYIHKFFAIMLILTNFNSIFVVMALGYPIDIVYFVTLGFLQFLFSLIGLFLLYLNKNEIKEFLKTKKKPKTCFNCGFKLIPPFKVCPNCRGIQIFG